MQDLLIWGGIHTGKVVFTEPAPKKDENEAATWREKLDQLYKSSSQNFRVVVHGSKVRRGLVRCAINESRN